MKKKITSYLDHLTFDPKLREMFIAKYLTNFRLVGLLLISILILGVYSFFTLPRRLNPKVEIPIVSVVTVLPGASPEDVESLVTIPIEDALQGIANVSTITSISRDNVSTTVIEFVSTIDPDAAEAEVEEAVDTVRDLPEDAKDPSVVALDFEADPIWMFSVSSNTDDGSLMRFVSQLEDKLEDLSEIDDVFVVGLLDQEVQVLIDQQRAREFGVDPQLLSQAVSSAVSSYPAGFVAIDGYSFSITIDPVAESVDSLREMRIAIPNGGTVLLGDIATVSEAPTPNQSSTYVADSENSSRRAVSFTLTKTKSSDVDAAVVGAQNLVKDEIALYGEHFKLHTTLDGNKEVQEQFGELVSSFGSTILLVFLTIMVFLGIRQAAITSFSIPLTFLVAMTVMNATGITINFLSLFSLLLAMGLLVDDTIVIIISTTMYYRQGKFSPQEVGLLVWRDFIVPIWSTTITTVWAFIPLLLATGIIGEFIKSIPIVVSATLIASTSIAVLITLPLMMIVLKPNIPKRVKVLLRLIPLILGIGLFYFVFADSSLLIPILVLFVLAVAVAHRVRKSVRAKARNKLQKSKILDICWQCVFDVVDHGFINFAVVSTWYQKMIKRILHSRRLRAKTVIGVIIFSIFSYLLLPLGFVVNEFFPGADQEQLYLQVQLPEGTRIEQATEEMLVLLDEVRSTKDILFVQGESGRAFSGGIGGIGTSSLTNVFVLSFALPEEEVRESSSVEIAASLRDQFKDYDSGDVSVIELSGGPPAGADMQVSFLGDDLSQLDAFADQTIAYLKEQDGVANVRKSIEAGTSKLVFVPDRAKLGQYNISEQQLGLKLRSLVSGFTLDTVKFNSDEQDVVFRTSSSDIDPSALSSVTIDTQTGPVPLLLLGSFELKPNPTRISREGGKRTISVTAAVVSGFSATSKNQELAKFVDSINLPFGYSWQTGGANEENERSVQSIIQAMALSAILILATMVIQLGSYRKAVIVLLTIPLAVSGVFIMFALTGTSLSFPALIGLLALFGIVVNNSIMIVEKINQNIKIGMELIDAISDAAAGRVEPIFFSSLTTIMGLIPITLSNPLWQGTGGAIISGVLFSGSIMLFFIPVVYYMWFADKATRKLRRIKY